MLFTIVKKCSNIDDDDPDVNINEIMNEEINKTKVPQEQDKIKKRMLIKGKIQSVAKLNRMFSTLREE